ncbi:MAG: hypothetical protein WCO94_03125 [Verrucomicrobiota bacterium]
MIIHFVAYPNTKDYLLLQAFYKIFGIPWYEADISNQSDLIVSEEEQLGGYRSAGEPWRTFFDKHNSSQSSLIFARTRRLPQDALPFVYVSRHPANIFMDAAKSQHSDGIQDSTLMLREIYGIGVYPDWSAHYLEWKAHKERVSGYFVRLEDFCADPLRTLVKLAVRLHLPKPQAFQEYSCPLPPDHLAEFDAIDPALKSLLLALHGTAMSELGYLQSDHTPTDKLLEGLPSSILAKALTLLRDESNLNKKKANEVQTMASYIESLENQYKLETGNLIDRINKLTKRIPA